MTNKTLFFILLLATSCQEVVNVSDKKSPLVEKNDVLDSTFQDFMDAAGVNGSILILRDNIYYSNDFEWAKSGKLPASTFKIPNSIVALELNVIKNDSTLIEWDGKPRYQKRWEQDLTFKEAFHYSCVPCYQEIARTIGVKRMDQYMNEFNYGSMQFDSTNLDMFWLEGASKISQHDQINFLKTFNEQGLPISERTYSIMQRMMIIEETEEYVLRGKTGWSVQDDIDNCWFVGYVKSEKGFCYFATNIEPGDNTDVNNIATIRKAVTFEALKSLGVINE